MIFARPNRDERYVVGVRPPRRPNPDTRAVDRSAYLRATLKVMRSVKIAEELRDL